MDLGDFLGCIELHDVAGIRRNLSALGRIEEGYQGRPWIELLIGEYNRSPQFRKCAQVFLDCGDQIGDDLLAAVLTDDAEKLSASISQNPEGIHQKYSFSSAYTPFLEVTLLHLCAEFNHVSCAEVLVKSGLEIDAKAGLDEFGFGGQTPIFHTVNQNSNQSKEMMEFCLAYNCNLDYHLKGLVWGKDRPWETFIPAINPISYAMMGLLPQMHRKEATIAETVSRLINHRHGINYTLPNIPNRYLKS